MFKSYERLAFANGNSQAIVNSILLKNHENTFMNESETRIKNLKRLIQEKSNSAAEFSRTYGTDSSYLSQLLNRHRSFGEKAARNIEESVGLARGELDRPHNGVEEASAEYSTRAAIPMKSIDIRASNDSSGGFEIHYEDDETLKPVYYRRDWLIAKGYKEKNLSVRRVSGSSMEGSLFDGDQVLINEGSRSPRNGVVFAIEIDGNLEIKRLRKRAREWWITSDNQAYSHFDQPLENLEQVIGEAVDKSSSHI